MRTSHEAKKCLKTVILIVVNIVIRCFVKLCNGQRVIFFFFAAEIRHCYLMWKIRRFATVSRQAGEFGDGFCRPNKERCVLIGEKIASSVSKSRVFMDIFILVPSVIYLKK